MRNVSSTSPVMTVGLTWLDLSPQTVSRWRSWGWRSTFHQNNRPQNSFSMKHKICLKKFALTSSDSSMPLSTIGRSQEALCNVQMWNWVKSDTRHVLRHVLSCWSFSIKNMISLSFTLVVLQGVGTTWLWKSMITFCAFHFKEDIGECLCLVCSVQCMD